MLSALLTYAGSDFNTSLALGAIFFIILLWNPIGFQTKKEREEMLERLNKNRDKIMMLHEQNKIERKEAKKRSKSKE